MHALDSWLDLAVYHGELFDKLELAAPALVGHSFGALARRRNCCGGAEAGRPAGADRSGRAVAGRPAGQELDGPQRQSAPALAVCRSRRRGGAALLRGPERSEARVDTLAQFIWAQACTGKFVWPIADRGFNKRAHRIAAPTLIVWGKADGIIAPAYAQEFAKRISGARVELIDKAGHLPHLEQPETVIKAVRGFLGRLSGALLPET